MTRSNALRGGVVAAAFTALAAIAPVHNVFADTPAAKAPVVLCAVKGERIADPAKAAGKAEYKGKTYYFCCPGCITKFDADPAKYAAAADAAATKH